MDQSEWWDAERKAAEFWHRLKENQKGEHPHVSANAEKGSAPGARNGELGNPGAPAIAKAPLVRPV